MLTESEVIAAVCDYLKSHNFSVTRTCTETQRGYDIVAQHPAGREVRIEAKGETSSKSTSKNYGKPFSQSQVHVHVSVALYCAAAYVDAGVLAGVAFPKNAAHIKQVRPIEAILNQLKIEIFWVASDRTVEVASHWA